VRQSGGASDVDFELSPQAERDFDDIMAYYTEHSSSAAAHFEVAYDELVERLEQFPELASRLRGPVRRALLHDFRIGLFYVLYPDRGMILRILHTSRSTEEWPTEP
jgi:plasmid stabilization system protein ParE